jgi:NADH dehydrogenase/NADH:ubiquinone oxidoreductase subunit G
MIKLTINGRTVEAREGEMLLTVIRRQGIEIPALCHHDAVEPFGACRLCTVEITKPSWQGWKNYVTSCLYPVEEGLVVETHSPEVMDIRRTLVDLQLAANPGASAIVKLADEMGLRETSFEIVPDADECILCGLCTRICDELGFSAISTVNRGHGKEVAPPLDEPPPDCVGCLACAHLCPTDFIKFTDTPETRTIWGKEFRMVTCETCGRPLNITPEMVDHYSKVSGLGKDYFTQCPQCKRKHTAEKFVSLMVDDRELF